MTKSDKNFEVARGVSQLSDFSRTKIGCIVVDGKRILSSGYNSNKTNPTQQRYNHYRNIDVRFPAKVHAEVSALNSLIGKKKSILLDLKFSFIESFVTGLWLSRDLARVACNLYEIWELQKFSIPQKMVLRKSI